MGEEFIKEELIVAFVQLLKDNEAEVRSAAASQLPEFSGFLDQDAVIQSITPAVKDLVTDASQHVRAAVAQKISGLAPILGKLQLSARLRAFWPN